MRKRRMMDQINVVPYIDVMLVLLVIFMVTAPMTNPGVVELPKVGQSLKQKSNPIVISVKKNSKIEIKGKKLLREKPYSIILKSDIKVVAQLSRLDTTSQYNSFMTSLGWGTDV